jgi:4-diphosphocytidyl-2-C-methyl-D-erythritol kinase
VSTTTVLAPAKLTWSLKVGERRADGYHDLEAEMVTLDLVDELELAEPGEGIELLAEGPVRAEGLELGATNLIARALELVGRRARVRLTKRIPLGGGLGGGSADAGAVLRWAGVTDLGLAARLGGDVPFCSVGGRALVRGLGEQVEPLEHLERAVLLLLPPFGVDTAAAYRALDELRAEGRGRHERNDLTEAAERVAPTLRRWREALGDLTGMAAVLAGSGSTLFVEGSRSSLGLLGLEELEVDGARGLLLEARSVPKELGRPRIG